MKMKTAHMAATERPDGCYHCGSALPALAKSGTIKGETLEFCCNGCLAVAQYIHEAGLESYYDRRDAGGAPVPVFTEAEKAAEYAPRYARETGDTIETSLMIDGIHCAACVWLIEKTVGRVAGVVEAAVNFSTHRMTVSWVAAETSLKQIIEKIRSIGYRAAEYDASAEAPFVKKKNEALLKMSVAGFSAVTTVFLADGLYGGYLWGIDDGFKNYLQWVSLFAAIPAVFYSGSAFIIPAYNGLRNRAFTMDLTVGLGALITFFYSVWATVQNRGDVYFDTVAMFIFLILAGRFLEAAYRRKAWSDTQRLAGLRVESATIVRDGVRLVVDIGSVAPGDTVEVKPGEAVPLDGVVLEGSSSVDESMLTGESKPVEKSAGLPVYASTMNTHGTLRFAVTRTGPYTVLSRITGLVEMAQSRKAAVQVLSDKLAGYFVPIVLAVAAATYLGWSYYDPAHAVIYAVAVLIITCPCALALATPAAIIIGCGAAAKDGVIVKSGAALEKLHKATHIVFDKTGTLTEGTMSVVAVLPAKGGSEEEVLGVAAAVEQFSEHPAGKAIYAEAQRRGAVVNARVEGFRAIGGKGVEATVKGSIRHAGKVVELAALSAPEQVIAGSRSFLDGRGVAIPVEFVEAEDRANALGDSAVYVAATQTSGEFKLLGVVMLTDPIRPSSAGLVKGLKEMGLTVTMLSGDNRTTAQTVAVKLGIESVVAAVVPEGKQDTIKGLKKEGEVVVMVGDGINDGPALATADVGVAVGSGAELAVGSADIVLLNPDPMSVLRAIEISKNTFGAIKGNLLVSLVYNVVLMPLAAFGYIVPVVAAVAMPLSSILVIANSVKAARKTRRAL